jgi:adenine-specific DNA-methyltransferase
MKILDSQLAITSHAEQQGYKFCDYINRVNRSNLGQFFSPIETAYYLSTHFSNQSFSDKITLHDSGAGAGVLTAAFVDSLIARVSSGKIDAPSSVTLIAAERDDTFIKPLKNVLKRCKQALEELGINTVTRIIHGDWIETSVKSLEKNFLLFDESKNIPPATHCILNPPYKKLTSSSRQRQLLSRLGIETTNLYSAFVWLAMLHLKHGGELSAITPRSFCNGPYFKPFREAILETMDIKLLHLIESRTETFQRDKVLQENIIYHLKKKSVETTDKARKVKLFIGDYHSPQSKLVALSEVVHPTDPQQFFHFSINDTDEDSRDFVMNQKATLEQLKLSVSTGPVVDYRQRDDLRYASNEVTVPLIYPHLIKNGKVIHPPKKSEDSLTTRHQKKPVAIVASEQSVRFLIDKGCYVLVKRFSSKEEKRRVVAAVLYPSDFPEERLGIENHINYFHSNGKGLPEELAEGLAAYLNSEQVDQYFRQFNGHTQVNATDLRSFKYPTEKELIKLAEENVEATS